MIPNWCKPKGSYRPLDSEEICPLNAFWQFKNYGNLYLGDKVHSMVGTTPREYFNLDDAGDPVLRVNTTAEWPYVEGLPKGKISLVHSRPSPLP
jgi:hypothetical protein